MISTPAVVRMSVNASTGIRWPSIRPTPRGSRERNARPSPANPQLVDLVEKLVLPDRIELTTSPLPMECSTTELRQHARYRRIGPKKAPAGGRFLPQGPRWRKRAGGPGRGQNGQKP